MGKLIKSFSILTIVAGLVLLVSLAVYFKYMVMVEYKVSDKMYLLQGDAGESVYEELEFNSIRCSLSTVSELYQTLTQSGYIDEKIVTQKDYIDITMTGSSLVYRLVYTKDDATLLIVCSDYNKSYEPLLYLS